MYLKKDSPTKVFPPSIIDNVFYFFPSYNNETAFPKRIALPFSDVNIINIVDTMRPYEIQQCRQLVDNYEISFQEKGAGYILPIAVIDNENSKSEYRSENLEINIGGEITNIALKHINRFHYVPIYPEISNASLKTQSNSLIVGKPLLFDQKDIKKRKVVIHLFIDAFSQVILEDFGESIFSNSYSFFKDGYRFSNTYAQTEWTLSSITSIFTGKYLNEHMIYHPSRLDKIQDTTIAELMGEMGFNTFGVSSVPKLTPLNGFDKGFDRFIMAKFANAPYIIDQCIDYMDTFNIEKQYLFVGLFDLHEAHRLQPISSQALNNKGDFVFEKFSRRKPSDTYPIYDTHRINQYKNHVKYLDKKLKILYQYLESNFDEITAVLHSDHGISFNTKTSEILGKEREKVPMMFRSDKISSKDIDDISEVKSVHHFLKDDICNNEILIKNHKYIITESLYPNRNYHIAVRSNENVLFWSVSWESVLGKNIDNVKTSYFKLNDELNEIEKDGEYYEMLNHANSHCQKLFLKSL